mgnify:CR=1 FL=1
MTAPQPLYSDADNHFYEAEDCYTRHIEAKFRDRTLQLVTQKDGTRKPMVDGREYTYLPNPFLHFGRPGTGMQLVAGMTFTIEPMINAGRKEVKLLPDNWTVVTHDHSLSAQWEHTVLVTESGHEVLTIAPGDEP